MKLVPKMTCYFTFWAHFDVFLFWSVFLMSSSEYNSLKIRKFSSNFETIFSFLTWTDAPCEALISWNHTPCCAPVWLLQISYIFWVISHDLHGLRSTQHTRVALGNWSIHGNLFKQKKCFSWKFISKMIFIFDTLKLYSK